MDKALWEQSRELTEPDGERLHGGGALKLDLDACRLTSEEMLCAR